MKTSFLWDDVDFSLFCFGAPKVVKYSDGHKFCNDQDFGFKSLELDILYCYSFIGIDIDIHHKIN